jgi:hypothetical protein
MSILIKKEKKKKEKRNKKKKKEKEKEKRRNIQSMHYNTNLIQRRGFPL